jgi:hypothetical protein
MKRLLAGSALGALGGLLAHYLFGAPSWGSFLAGMITGFVANRLNVLPPWNAPTRPRTQ